MDKTLQRWANIAVIAFAVYYFGGMVMADYHRRVAEIERIAPSIYANMDR